MISPRRIETFAGIIKRLLKIFRNAISMCQKILLMIRDLSTRDA